MRISLQSEDTVDSGFNGKGRLTAKTTVEGAVEKYRMLHERNPNDTTLSIALLDQDVTDELFGGVIKAILAEGKIKTLELTDCQLSADDLRAIKQVLIDEKTLATLNLSSNVLCDEGMEVVVEILECNTNVTELLVSSNSITDKGAEILGNFLSNDTTLKTVSISGNGITTVERLLNHNVHKLLLNENQIKNIDPMALALSSGSTIDFSDNKITSLDSSIINYFLQHGITADFTDNPIEKITNTTGGNGVIILGSEISWEIPLLG
jgi:Ran GTPase-activating protein (RanGAP) involved in mRNA processing and transport